MVPVLAPRSHSKLSVVQKLAISCPCRLTLLWFFREKGPKVWCPQKPWQASGLCTLSFEADLFDGVDCVNSENLERMSAGAGGLRLECPDGR